MIDWVLRRLFKILIKKNVGLFLATEVDVAQLGVELDKGAVELRECLLDAAYLNSRLVSWRRGCASLQR